MAREFGACFQRILWLSALALVFAVLSAWPMSAAKAQVIERGVQGGVVGAIIGGVVGGGRGVGTGAAIGAGVGLVTGAAEADANARAYYDSQYYGAPPPPPGGSDLVFNIQTSLARLGSTRQGRGREGAVTTGARRNSESGLMMERARSGIRRGVERGRCRNS
jgi:hypothetical protein